MLKYRIISALVLVPLIILAIYLLPVFWFALLMAVIVALAAWEWGNLIGYKQWSLKLVYVIATLAALYLVVFIPSIYLLWAGFIAYLYLLAALLTYQFWGIALGCEWALIKIILGLVIAVAFWVALLVLKGSPQLGDNWLLFVILIVWGADTGAYIAGKRWGRHHLIPKVSPNKTWEGLLGGVILALVITVAGSYFFHLHGHQRLLLAGIALLASIFSMIGDLSVSLLKRLMGLKDTGHLIPGHGGLLDRLDSLMAGLIVFVLGRWLI